MVLGPPSADLQVPVWKGRFMDGREIAVLRRSRRAINRAACPWRADSFWVRVFQTSAVLYSSTARSLRQALVDALVPGMELSFLEPDPQSSSGLW